MLTLTDFLRMLHRSQCSDLADMDMHNLAWWLKSGIAHKPAPFGNTLLPAKTIVGRSLSSSPDYPELTNLIQLSSEAK